MRNLRFLLIAAVACGLLTGGLSLHAQAGLYSRDQIDQMVAPIALYPDALMSQVLMAATFPEQVNEADQWVRANPDLSGQQLDDALSTATWDPSIIALCKFPTVLDKMADNIKWTTDLGNAFLNQKADVMDAVQTLRRAAYDQGTLRTTPQQRVEVQQQAIVIQPYTPDVIYVPAYQPAVVYGPVWSFPTYYYPDVWVPSPGASFVNGFFWGLGFTVGNVLFGGCDWFHHDVYVNNAVIVHNTIFHNSPYYRHGNWRRGGYGRHPWVRHAAYLRGGHHAPYGGRSHGRVRGIHNGPRDGHSGRAIRADGRTPGAPSGRRYARGAAHGPTGRYALRNNRADRPGRTGRSIGRSTRPAAHGPTGRYALRNDRSRMRARSNNSGRSYTRASAHGPTGRYAARGSRTPRYGSGRSPSRSYNRSAARRPSGYSGRTTNRGRAQYGRPSGYSGRNRAPSVTRRSTGYGGYRANRPGRSSSRYTSRGRARTSGRASAPHRGGGRHQRRR